MSMAIASSLLLAALMLSTVQALSFVVETEPTCFLTPVETMKDTIDIFFRINNSVKIAIERRDTLEARLLSDIEISCVSPLSREVAVKVIPGNTTSGNYRWTPFDKDFGEYQVCIKKLESEKAKFLRRLPFTMQATSNETIRMFVIIDSTHENAMIPGEIASKVAHVDKSNIDFYARDISKIQYLIKRVKTHIDDHEARAKDLRTLSNDTFTRAWVVTLATVLVACALVWFQFRSIKRFIVKKKLV